MTKRVIRILLLLVLIGIASMFLYADVLIRESIKHSLAKLGVVEQLEVGYPHFGSISVPRLVVTLPFRGLLHRIDAANVSIEYSLRDLVVDKVTIRSLAIDVIGKAEPKPPENKVEPRGTFPLEAVSIEKLKLSDAREAQTKLLLEGEGRAELTGSDTTIWSTLSLSLELLSTYGVLTKETLPAADMLTLTARIELKESDLRLFLEEAKTNTLRIERDGLKSSIDRLSVNKADLYYPPFSKSSGLETELDEWTLVVQKNRVIVPNAALSVRLGEGGKQTLKANLNASHVTLNEIPLQGLSVTATVPLTAELKPNGAVVLALAIERVQLGFPLSELKASASLTRSKINKIEELSFKAFGAKVRLVEFKKNAKAGCDEARFKIEQLDIEQVATLYGKDKIKATGIADGTLPVE